MISELLLLFACATMSVLVALMCLRKNATEPVDRFEATIFSADLWLTIGYAVLVISHIDKTAYAAIFRFLGNVTTLTSFMPILPSTWRDPRREQPVPWIVWSMAYLLLTAATLQTTGLNQPVLLIYPVANVALHVPMALFSLRKTLAGRYFGGDGSFLYHDSSPIAGEGVFAGRDFSAGERIWTMTGMVYGNSRTGAIDKTQMNYKRVVEEELLNPDIKQDWNKVLLSTLEGGLGAELDVKVFNYVQLRTYVGVIVFSHLSYPSVMSHEKTAAAFIFGAGVNVPSFKRNK